MKTDIQHTLVEEVNTLSLPQQRVVLDFVHFLRIKTMIDPTQAYFWTRRWQQLEQSAERAKITGRRLGDGTVGNLLKILKTQS